MTPSYTVNAEFVDLKILIDRLFCVHALLAIFQPYNGGQ